MTNVHIRYCVAQDGVRIAYTTQGEGTPLVMCPFFVESLTLGDRLPEYREFVDGLGRARQLVRFDMRGTGLSQRTGCEFTLEALTRDISAVVTALHLPRFVLYGAGLSGPRAIAYAALHPDEVSHLVLYSTFARPTAVMEPQAAHGFVELARSNWHVAAQAIVDLSGRQQVSDLNLRGAKMIRESSNGEQVAALLDATMKTSDVSGLLSRVQAPTLVIQSTATELFRSEFGPELASGIPDARLQMFESTFNWLDAGAGTHVGRMVDEFLGAAPEAKEQRTVIEPAISGTRTVLFTDIVGHTEMMSRLGDARGRDVLREHERITRETLKQHGGAEVKTMGDGFMASFGSVTAAMECAIALQRAFANALSSSPSPARGEGSESVAIRIGLNAGEPIEEDGDLFGATVILASRIAAQAGAGEILAPDTVRGLLSGKGFVFGDRGEFVPKGFDERVRLWDVRWRE